MNPREFQQFASKLANGNSPAEFRTAISRAYYAAYNVGVEVLEEMGFRISEGPAGHGEVRHHLNNSHDIEMMRVASQLGELHSKRIHADYRLHRKDVENKKTAQTLVERANKMIQTLDRCCSGPKRVQIVEAIQDWKQKTSGTS